jgi:hypothetical protein
MIQLKMNVLDVELSTVFFLDSWFGVLHYIAGEHEWADGECTHGPLVATEVGKTCLGTKTPKHSRKFGRWYLTKDF